MPIWRCPHCGTPQAETARCWVCRRSSTACVTCRHFRRSVAAQLGYCGRDRERRPLRGDEIRACWEASTAPDELPIVTTHGRATAPMSVVVDRTPVRKLEFVEVETRPVRAKRKPAGETPGDPVTETEFADAALPVNPGEARWSLWSDAEV